MKKLRAFICRRFGHRWHQPDGDHTLKSCRRCKTPWYVCLVLFVGMLLVPALAPPAQADVAISQPTATAPTIGGYPLRPILSGHLTTTHPWVVWGGTTLSVDRPGGKVQWLLGTSLWVAANGHVLPYWGEVSATVWVEQSTAFCTFFYCRPTTWNLMGPSPGCTVTAAAHAQAWTLGDRGCWPARNNVSFYKITAVLTWKVPLDVERDADGVKTHGAIMESAPMLVRY